MLLPLNSKVQYLHFIKKLSWIRKLIWVAIEGISGAESILVADHGRRFIGQSITGLLLNCNWLSITAAEAPKRPSFTMQKNVCQLSFQYALTVTECTMLCSSKPHKSLWKDCSRCSVHCLAIILKDADFQLLNASCIRFNHRAVNLRWYDHDTHTTVSHCASYDVTFAQTSTAVRRAVAVKNYKTLI